MRVHDYLRRGDVLFIPLSTNLISATGLIPHLRDGNRLAPKLVRRASVSSFSTGSSFLLPRPPFPLLIAVAVLHWDL